MVAADGRWWEQGPCSLLSPCWRHRVDSLGLVWTVPHAGGRGGRVMRGYGDSRGQGTPVSPCFVGKSGREMGAQWRGSSVVPSGNYGGVSSWSCVDPELTYNTQRGPSFSPPPRHLRSALFCKTCGVCHYPRRPLQLLRFSEAATQESLAIRAIFFF